ncbi:MAG: hypothetical protein PGN09_06840 [Sphingomonas fennica]
MDAPCTRRTAIGLGGAALAAGLVAAPAAAARPAAGGTMLFDPALPRSRALAIAARAAGERLVALPADPMRAWVDSLVAPTAPLHGVTRWSDYLVLAELARERGRRVRREERHAAPGEPLLVHWTVA